MWDFVWLVLILALCMIGLVALIGWCAVLLVPCACC